MARGSLNAERARPRTVFVVYYTPVNLHACMHACMHGFTEREREREREQSHQSRKGTNSKRPQLGA